MDNNDLGMKATNNDVAQPDPIKANIDEEAKAEEAFVNDDEDTVFNPFVENGDTAEEEEILTDADMEIPGAVGSGNLETVMPSDPINNEVTFSGEDVKMQDLQSDIDTKSSIDDEALPSAEETVKVNVGESMQPEEKPEVENTELASQMDSLLNDDVVENTTPETDTTAQTEAPTTPTADAPAEGATSNSPVAEAVAANPVVDAASPAPAESSVEATVQAAEPVKKKGGAGKIIAIIVLLLILIGGGIGAVLFINWHESKDKVASDAMSKLLNIKLTEDKIVNNGNGIGVTKISGKTTVTLKDVKEFEKGDHYAYLKSTVSSFDAELDDVNFKLKSSVTFNYTDDKSETMGIESAYLSGGKIYVKLGDIESYGSILNGLVGYRAVNENDGQAVSDDDKSEAVKELEKKQQELLTSSIENQWIGVSNETFKYLINSEEYNDEFSCITSGLEKVAKDSKAKMLEAYEANSFFEFGDSVENLSGAKDGLTYYEIKIDEDKFKEFSKAVAKIDASVEITKCFSSMTEEYTKSTDGKVSQTAEETEKKDKVTTKYYFGVKSWSHEVMNVIVETDSKESKTVSNYDLGYDSVKVAEPGDAKQFEKVAEDTWKAYIKLIEDNMDAYVESECGESDGNYFFVYCKEDAIESFNKMKDLSFRDVINSSLSMFSGDDDDYDVIDNCGADDEYDVNCIDWDDEEDWDF